MITTPPIYFALLGRPADRPDLPPHELTRRGKYGLSRGACTQWHKAKQYGVAGYVNAEQIIYGQAACSLELTGTLVCYDGELSDAPLGAFGNELKRVAECDSVYGDRGRTWVGESLFRQWEKHLKKFAELVA